MPRSAWLAVLLLASPVEAHRAQGDEEQIEESVREALGRSGVDTKAVQVKVRGRVVFLSGDVKTARDKLRAIQAAFSISEVEEVESGLEVRSGGTPELEEQIWMSLLQEGLDSFVSEVLVKAGVASVEGEVPDAATRDRVLAIARETPGVDSVRDEMVLPVAEETAPPEPPMAPPPPVDPPAVPPELKPPTATPSVAVPAHEPPRVEPPAEGKPPAAPLPPPVPEPPAAPQVDPPAVPPEVKPPTATPPVPERLPEPPTVEPPAKPPAALLPEPPPGIPASPPQLPQLIVREILTYRGYTVFDQIQFSVDGADVTLNGAVTEATKKQEIEERVRSIPGIGKLENQVRVLPASKTDDKLREVLFRRIYEDPMFAELADEPNPPIHIIVEHSRVTLTGMVDKVIERMSAEAMVRNAFGVAGVKNQLRVRQ
jgi:osmotically-inducible protein OsmY